MKIKPPKVFLALPSALARKDSNLTDESGINRLRAVESFKRLIQKLRDQDVGVYCYLEACSWSDENFGDPTDSVPKELNEMLGSNHLIACPSYNKRISGGVHFLIGWAMAFDMRTTFIINGFYHSTMITGLRGVTRSDVESYTYQIWPDETFEMVVKRVLT